VIKPADPQLLTIPPRLAELLQGDTPADYPNAGGGHLEAVVRSD
jgi:hypothetical protein